MLEKILTFEPSWFDDEANSSGALSSRLSNEATMVKSLVADRMSLLIQLLRLYLIKTHGYVAMSYLGKLALVRLRYFVTRSQDGPRRQGVARACEVRSGVVLDFGLKELTDICCALDICTGKVIADAGSMTSDIARGSTAVASVFSILDRQSLISSNANDGNGPSGVNFEKLRWRNRNKKKATSAFDVQSEQVVQEALDQDNGKVVEQGTYNQLKNKQGAFFQLANIQKA
ncbi:putative ABC transporter B family member 8 [Tanacetum coccineum]